VPPASTAPYILTGNRTTVNPSDAIFSENARNIDNEVRVKTGSSCTGTYSSTFESGQLCWEDISEADRPADFNDLLVDIGIITVGF
jgi:hypothetical protein